MFRTVTSKVDSHRVNPNYECLVYDLLHDPTFHFQGNLTKADWMPREDDVLDIVEDLLRVSPTFGAKLWAIAVSVPLPTEPRVARSKPVTNLAEMLL